MTGKRLFVVLVVLVAGGLTAYVAYDRPGRVAAQDAPPPAGLPLLKTFVAEFVEITPGNGDFPARFRMGSDAPGEGPPRDVAMENPFAIAKYEVTQSLYETVMGRNPSRWKGPRNAAEMMSWTEAVEFCTRATRLLRDARLIAADEEIRLPSEAEWEYCCRAGTTSAYSFGPSAQAPGDEGTEATLLDPYAWHTGNAAGNDPPVGALKPNPWGLYDMHGYLWEYCSDAWSEDHAAAPPNAAPRPPRDASDDRVARGGSWQDGWERLSSSSRRAVALASRGPGLGFRCVKSVAAAAPRDAADRPLP